MSILMGAKVWNLSQTIQYSSSFYLDSAHFLICAKKTCHSISQVSEVKTVRMPLGAWASRPRSQRHPHLKWVLAGSSRICICVHRI